MSKKKQNQQQPKQQPTQGQPGHKEQPIARPGQFTGPSSNPVHGSPQHGNPRPGQHASPSSNPSYGNPHSSQRPGQQNPPRKDSKEQRRDAKDQRW